MPLSDHHTPIRGRRTARVPKKFDTLPTGCLQGIPSADPIRTPTPRMRSSGSLEILYMRQMPVSLPPGRFSARYVPFIKQDRHAAIARSPLPPLTAIGFPRGERRIEKIGRFRAKQAEPRVARARPRSLPGLWLSSVICSRRVLHDEIRTRGLDTESN
jgi:hypothetical protein